MSFVTTRKLLGGEGSLAGESWLYDFSYLGDIFTDIALKKYISWISRRAAKVSSAWNDEANSEWLVRMFLAARMTLGASVMASSRDYAEEKNLRIVIPYLDYYTLLYSMKSLVLTLPGISWNQGEIISQTHSKTINVVCDALAKLDTKIAAETKDKILKSKAIRELISYRAPSSGDNLTNLEGPPFQTCRVLLEVAQLTSEILERSIVKKNSGKRFEIIDEYIEQAFQNTIEGVNFFDDEDYYRIGYFCRKYPFPVNIYHMMSEGHVEDFFGSWMDDKVSRPR